MADDRTYHVTIRLAHDYQFVAEFDDVPNAIPLTLDEPPPLGVRRGPNAVAILGAAVGNCLAASVASSLRRSRIDLAALTAKVTTHVSRDGKGRHRVSAIDVELEPVLGNLPADGLALCDELFEDFCTVTASVKRGIPVHVKLTKTEPAGTLEGRTVPGS